MIALAVNRDIDGAMIERIGGTFSPGERIVWRKHAADERDDGDAVLSVAAQRIDIPPRITVWRNDPGEVRSASRLIAADRPANAAIGTPGPGCVLPPAR